MKHVLEWNYSEARIGMELSSTNTQQILQFLQLQQQAGSISTTHSLGYDNSESPSSGPVFSTETFKGADTNNEVDSDNDFDEEFFVEEIRKYPCIWDTKCRGYKDGTKKQNAWSQLCRLFNKEGRLIFIII